MSLNLEQQLTFYGSYHHNPVNVGIHMVCVPLILLSFFCMGTLTPTLIPLPSYLTVPNLPLTFGTICMILWNGFYVLLEPVAGTLVAPILWGCTAWFNHLTTVAPWPTTEVAAVIFLVCWVAQFIGHGAFEHRAPALIDNVLAAFFLAPFFVWMEVLFFFGYRPELQARVKGMVEKELVKLNSGGRNGAPTNGNAH